jgi:N,N'-diacetyllegionaminate synthase
MNNKTIVIAEAGVNHNGDMTLAKRLIEAAKFAGADIVKFQTFKAKNLVTQYAKKADYQITNPKDSETQYSMLNKLELTDEMHRELILYCKSLNIEFLSTAFDVDGIKFLKNLGQERFKISSGDITNLPLLRYIGSLGKEVILSTGMSTMNEVQTAIELLQQSGVDRRLLTVLHCTSEYPTPMANVNLLAMKSIQEANNVSIGYSDHTEGIEVAIAAASLGAQVIEKHFTLDRSLPGPDHMSSIEPSDLRRMVSAIKNINIALGNGIKTPTALEMKNKEVVRKSIVAKKNIKLGEVFSDENLAIKRPGTGICPMKWDDVIGKSAKRHFFKDELIEL